MKDPKKIESPYLLIRKCISILSLKKKEKVQIISQA